MICENNPLTPGSSDHRKQSHAYAAHLLRAISIAVGSTLLIVVLFLSLGRIRLPQTGRTLLVAFIYCTLIALPSIALLTRISHRYTERFPRLVVLIQALVLVATAIAGSFAAGLVFQMIGLVPRGWYWIELRGVLPFSILISLMIGMSMATYETLRYKLQATALELRTRQVEQERAYKLLAEARLSALESRIHPHFLFNTLNSIAALIPRDPQLAEDTVGKLASLLRFSLNANQSGLVPLRQELKIVRDYLEIEKTRFGSRLMYQIAAPAALDEVKVPPLSLQSLVENSVKHVVSKRQQGATIQIVAGEDSGRVILEVIDDGPGFALEAITPEHGIGNLIARLELLFGAEGRLEVTRVDEKTAVRISFPASLE
jgi:sensor histidine kinase YesM